MSIILFRTEQVYIDACIKTGSRDFFYIAPDNDGRGYDWRHYLCAETETKRNLRRRRIISRLRRYGYNKDGSKIVRNKNNESNETLDNNNNNNNNNIPPTNLPTQQNENDKNNLWLLAEVAAGCGSEVIGN